MAGVGFEPTTSEYESDELPDCSIPQDDSGDTTESAPPPQERSSMNFRSM